jgi:hypothetical protein
MGNNFIGEVLGYDGEAVPVYEMLSGRERRFFDAIASDDDLVAVLRGHLYVEADVMDILGSLSPDDSASLDDVVYAKKVARLKKKMPDLPPGVVATLEALGSLRNAFAHDLERALTHDDDERFFALLADDFKPSVLELIRRGAFPQTHGAMVRASIIVLHTGLSALRLGLPGANAPAEPVRSWWSSDLSIHRAGGWLQQYQRMLRWQRRIHLRLPGEARANQDYFDDCYAFFTTCLSLRDWLIADKVAKDTECHELFAASAALQVARDIANGVKHLNLTKPTSTDGFAIGRQYEEPPFVVFGTKEGRERLVLVPDLVDEAVHDWQEFLKAKGLV